MLSGSVPNGPINDGMHQAYKGAIVYVFYHFRSKKQRKALKVIKINTTNWSITFTLIGASYLFEIADKGA